jgi:hypothetical protein
MTPPPTVPSRIFSIQLRGIILLCQPAVKKKQCRQNPATDIHEEEKNDDAFFHLTGDLEYSTIP